MAIRKTEDANLRNEYPIWVQVGLVVTLAILITAFRLNYQTQGDFNVQMEQQEVVQMEEVKQTKQKIKPPPPPKPPVPVAVPNDQIIKENKVDFDASLDLGESLDQPTQPPPPPPKKEKEEEIFMVVEQQPKPVGGMQSIYENLGEYPDFARKAGIEGRVIIQFIVNEQGQATNLTVLQGVHPLLNEAAMKAIRATRFTPGKQRGRAVKVRMSLPVMFQLK
ncbi:energy transducer TonB [Salisaeta longa]|uniref:energy transducer TonB n=1 Tax=Salisaeta longa TaxID=503170 RepID=UPI0003B5DC07|nr:energy transducer TonB [Salisaeta longa]